MIVNVDCANRINVSSTTMPNRPDTLTANEAAAVLGVKIETLYAYVSRGQLYRTDGPDGRTSRFSSAEVEGLARKRKRTTSTKPTAWGPASLFQGDVGIQTSITEIAGGRLRYRSHDAIERARTTTFESAAELLWGMADPDPTITWSSDPTTTALARKVGQLLPPGAVLADHLRAITAVVAGADPLRFDLRPDAVKATARALLATLVDALPQRRPGGVPRLQLGDLAVTGSMAGRLWLRVSPVRPEGGVLKVLNAAMVLLADHELATSTFGVRVAASTRADPYACIATGLGVLSGILHGSASGAVHQLLLEASQPEGATAAVSRRLRLGELVPGFGHPFYPDGDPRAVALLDLLRASEPNPRRLAVVESVLATVGRRNPVPPNVDFALAALAFTSLMAGDAGEAIFALSRSAGWIAHALEEYGEAPLRYRARAMPKVTDEAPISSRASP
jgi:citrate synthase